MGDPQTTFWHELEIAFSKALGWLVWVTIGVAAKLAFESRIKKLSWKEIAAIVVISVFVGYLANLICKKTGYEDWGGIIVPVSTLLGQSIVNFVLTNWEKWIDKLLPPIFRIFKNGNGNGHKKDEKKD